MRWVAVILTLVAAVVLPYVMVSVKPLQLIVKEIYPGDVEILIDPDVNPHMFQLKPSDMGKVEKSEMLLVFGGGFEGWVKKLEGRVKICELSSVVGRASDENPHVWLDPVLTAVMAVKAEACLEGIHPELSVEMRKRLASFLQKLVDLSERIGEEFSRLDGMLLELRPALYHFLKRFFGGDYVTLVSQSQPSLSPRRLKEVLKLCKKEGLRYILIERNSSEKIAQPVVKGCGLKILKVDVLGSDAESYIEMIESVADVVKEALR